MRGKRFSEGKIVRILRAYSRGVNIKNLARTHGVSEQSIYRWKAKYGNMSVSEAKYFRKLEEENCRLKKRLADVEQDKVILRGVLSKKW